MEEDYLLERKFEEKKGVRREFFHGAVSIYEGGQMDLDGRVIEFDKGIKLSYNKNAMKVSAFYLLALAEAVKNDPEIYHALAERAREEQGEYTSFVI